MEQEWKAPKKMGYGTVNVNRHSKMVHIMREYLKRASEMERCFMLIVKVPDWKESKKMEDGLESVERL